MNRDDSILLKFIQECIRNGRFYFTTHALEYHPVQEGFSARQALEAIENGAITEHREDASRCLIVGAATGLEQSKDYITNYIHCVVDYDDINAIVIITMYRPRTDEWVNQFTRRR